MKTLTLTISGQPHSKKNSREFRQHGKAKFTVPGKNFEKFQANAIVELINQIKPEHRFGGAAVHIDYIFYKKGMMLSDVDNMICSINDVLQHERLRIIDDDKQIMKGTFEIVPGCLDWKTEITISEIELPGKETK